MRCVVVIKTQTGAGVDAEDVHWRGGRVLPGTLSPFDAQAVEAAVRLKESGTVSEVIALAMASSSEMLGAVREALAMGADRAALLIDSQIETLDLIQRSQVLAAFLRQEDARLYVWCPWNGDADGTILWGAAASRLGLAALCQAQTLRIENEHVIIERQVEDGDVTWAAPLPCCVELADGINKPRRPTLKAAQLARSKRVATMRLEGLTALPAPTVGLDSVQPVAPSRSPVLHDDTAGLEQIVVDFLEARGLMP
jgi:electron transfer flavoprotein beta subunit